MMKLKNPGAVAAARGANSLDCAIDKRTYGTRRDAISKAGANLRLPEAALTAFTSLFGKPAIVTPTEARWGRKGSKRLLFSTGRVYDFETGFHGDALDWKVREHGLALSEAAREAGGAMVAPLSVQVERKTHIERNTDFAAQLWREAAAISATLAERYYVEQRKLPVAELGDLSHALRWHDGRMCIVALMTDPETAKPGGIHRTFLDSAGRKVERKMLGKAGVVRLSADAKVTSGLGICEGVEDGLALLLAGWRPVWACCSAGAIARFPVLNGVEALTIFCDGDVAGLTAAQECADRWNATGGEGTIAFLGGADEHQRPQ